MYIDDYGHNVTGENATHPVAPVLVCQALLLLLA